MKRFWLDAIHELKRSIPRMLYFLRTGRLHPEVRPVTIRFWDSKFQLLGTVQGDDPMWHLRRRSSGPAPRRRGRNHLR